MTKPATSSHVSTTPVSARDQPWRAVWPATKDQVPATEYTVLYGYHKGAKMMTQGSAGEANMSIIYDTGSSGKSSDISCEVDDFNHHLLNHIGLVVGRKS